MGETDPTVSELIDELAELTDLSEREAEVVAHMTKEAERCETDTEARRAVARGLGIEPSTVDTYYRRALEKFKKAAETTEYMDNELGIEP